MYVYVYTIDVKHDTREPRAHNLRGYVPGIQYACHVSLGFCHCMHISCIRFIWKGVPNTLLVYVGLSGKL